ncbi:MAG: esterase [Chloroflexi bacterium]|nr:esterase [Chloroflexota bacterium]
MTQTGGEPVSPEIHADGCVTFRLWAPDAPAVSVRNTTGGYADWPGGNEVPLPRDGDGLWQATIGPLPPEYYTYVFEIGGVPSLDPGNTLYMRDGARYSSTLRVPGSHTVLYDVNPVPHGTLHQVWYASPTLGMDRRMYIYTPPGYERGTERYPVLYLLHGGGNDEDGWTSLGRAPQILDNLLAQGLALPMIVVMPNGNGLLPASPDYVPLPAGWQRPSPGTHILRFPDSLVPDVIPFVDEHYRTLTSREDRAIAGLSMGGAQTMYCAFRNLDHFAWVAVLSGGFPLLPGAAVDIPAPPQAERLRGPDITRVVDPGVFTQLIPNLGPEANSRLRLFELQIGTEDGLISTHEVVKRLLDERGVRYTLRELAGYAHEWRFWRIALANLAQRLFQPSAGAA